MLSLDFRAVEGRLAAGGKGTESPDHLFDRLWALTLLDHVLECLRAEYVEGEKEALFEALKPLLTGRRGRSLAEIGAAVDMSEAAVRVAAHRMRRRYRGLLEGEIAESATTRSSMLRGLAIGLLGIFVLLSFQFRSYVEPLIVMAAIPFALIGVVWGHLLMGLNLSMPSLLGLVSLAGVVVNDSILLVVFVKTRRREGLAVEEAAGRARLGPLIPGAPARPEGS